MLSLPKVMGYRQYRIESLSAQVLGSQETHFDKQFKRLRDVAANFSTFNGSRSIALFKFVEEIRTSLNESHASKSVTSIMLGRPISMEAGRLYSFYVSADVPVSRITGTKSWPELIQ